MGASQSVVQRAASIETTKIADRALKASMDATEKQTQKCNQIDVDIMSLQKAKKKKEQERADAVKSKTACLDMRSRMKTDVDQLKAALSLGNSTYYRGNRSGTKTDEIGENRNRNRNNRNRNNRNRNRNMF